ncbi:MAG: hypothetical protein ACE5DN_01440 [Flavobacteriales bacterium]
MKTITTTLAVLIALATLATDKNKDGKPGAFTIAKAQAGPVATAYNKIDNLVSFNMVRKSGNTYLNWRTQGEQLDCVYLVERSTDGIHYRSVGVKKGFGTEANLVFLYSWVDRNIYTADDAAYYRVKKVDVQGVAAYTNALRIEYENLDNSSPVAEKHLLIEL